MSIYVCIWHMLVCVCERERERETDLEGDDICKTRRFLELMSMCYAPFFGVDTCRSGR